MKIETAIKQIEIESAFLGMPVHLVMMDILKYGRMVYSEKTMTAYKTIVDNGVILFAEPTVNETLRNRSTYFGNDI